MTGLDDRNAPGAWARPGAGLSPLSRRAVLRGAAAASGAGLAVTALAGVPALAASQPGGRQAPDTTPAESADTAGGDPVVVHVRDVRAGHMDVYRGTTHVRVTDRDLAARLARVSL